jgi:hypothetical protein
MTHSDVAFLVATILFCIAVVWNIVERSIQGAVVAAGFAALAIGFLIL